MDSGPMGPCGEREVLCLGRLSGLGERPAYWAGCDHNIEAAILNRITFKRPYSIMNIGCDTLDYAVQTFADVGILPTNVRLEPTEDYVMSKSGSQRAKYGRAGENLVLKGIRKYHFNVLMFPKIEAFLPDQKRKSYFAGPSQVPDPRGIQFRVSEGALVFRQFMGPLEKHFYWVTSRKLVGNARTEVNARGFSTVPVSPFGKGLSSIETGVNVAKAWSCFVDPVALLVDVSRADTCQGYELQCAKFKLYRHMIEDAGKRLIDAYMELYMYPGKCRTMTGLEYSSPPMLRSGDMDTGLGNNLTFFVLHTVFRWFLGGFLPPDLQLRWEIDLGFKHLQLASHDWFYFCNGDDVVPIGERATVKAASTIIVPFFRRFGVDLRIDGEAYKLEEINWCQSSPVATALGVRMVRDPHKICSLAVSGPKWSHLGQRAFRRRLHTIATCELVLNRGVPVIQEWALALMRNAGDTAEYDDLDFTTSSYWRARIELKAMHDTLRHYPPVDITDEARLSFEAAFGIGISEQLSMEERARSWVLPEGQEYDHFDISKLMWTAFTRREEF